MNKESRREREQRRSPFVARTEREQDKSEQDSWPFASVDAWKRESNDDRIGLSKADLSGQDVGIGRRLCAEKIAHFCVGFLPQAIESAARKKKKEGQ